MPGEGTGKALCRRPFRAERRFWTSSRVLSWISDSSSMTAWPLASSSSRFPTIWERLPWSPSTNGFTYVPSSQQGAVPEGRRRELDLRARGHRLGGDPAQEARWVIEVRGGDPSGVAVDRA